MDGASDDGRIRTGTLWTAMAHAITAIIGSGVLALPWSVAQMGWLIGPIVLVVCAYITYFTAYLLADCYRFPDPVNGKRNYTYSDAVRAFLGRRDVLICSIVQYALLWGTMIGYTITAATSMISLHRSKCYHKHGHTANCGTSGILYMVIFGLVEVILSQFPNLEKIAIMSVVATLMSFTYALIALFLCLVKFGTQGHIKGSLLGTEVGGLSGLPLSTKIWNEFQSLGNIAFAYSYAMILIEIQDTLKSPPAENKVIRRASKYSIGVTTLFYASIGCVGYAAFGNQAPGNVLTGFFEPFWLVDIANVAVVIHLFGAYQVFSQPVFAINEKWLASMWPETSFFNTVYNIRLIKSLTFQFTLSQLVCRTVFVIISTVLAMMLPFFNAIVGLLGSFAFWPLTIFFPVRMHIVQANIEKGSSRWVILHTLSVVCLFITICGITGSLATMVNGLKGASLFKLNL